MVDMTFDFETEESQLTVFRQRDDKYAHEIFERIPYDGLLVSKGVVEGVGRGPGSIHLLRDSDSFARALTVFFVRKCR